MDEGWIIALSIPVVILVLTGLVRWARRGGRGVILFASLFGFGGMADPLFEKQIRAVREAEDRLGGAEESGDPPAD